MARAIRELKLSGVIASAITPHHPNATEADFSAALELLDFIATGKATSIALLDAPGEPLSFSLDDRQRLVYLAVKRSRVPLVAGVSHPTLAGALQLAEDAIRSGADGLILMPPCPPACSDADAVEFCRVFAAETGDAIPLILHNAPATEPLLASGRFAAIADSSGDWARFESILALKSRVPISVFCADDRLAARALRAGADGLLSPSACAVPELFAALAAGKAADAAIAEFLDAIAPLPQPAALRRALELRGQKTGGSFIPLAPESAAALDRFSAWFPGFLARMKKEIDHG